MDAETALREIYCEFTHFFSHPECNYYMQELVNWAIHILSLDPIRDKSPPREAEGQTEEETELVMIDSFPTREQIIKAKAQREGEVAPESLENEIFKTVEKVTELYQKIMKRND